MATPGFGDTSGAGADERDCERLAEHWRGSRGVMKAVCQERVEKELPRGQPLDVRMGAPQRGHGHEGVSAEATSGSSGGVGATARA